MLLFAAIIAFGRSLWGSFHFDDYSLFSTDLWRPFDIRPLTYLTFWLNERLGGQNPAGYHAVNLGLHLIAVLLLWEALQSLVSSRAAWIGAAVFAVHPFQAEPVNYVFARSITLATVFCLASLLSWSRGRYWLAVVWFGAALLAKEECVAFPALLVLVELWRSRDKRGTGEVLRMIALPVLAMLALAAAAGIRVLLATSQTAGSGAGAQAGITWQSYTLAQGAAILRYFRMLILPWGFTADPDIAVPSVMIGLLAWLVVVLLAAFAAVLALRGNPAALWVLAAFLVLLPSSSILPAADLAADRRLYLPMIGFAAAAGLLLGRAHSGLVLAALVVLSWASLVRTEVWRTEASLWQDAVDKAPNKVRPKIQLARAVEPERGLALLSDAQRIAPEDPLIPAEQGRIYMGAGQPDQALLAFGRALALAPGNAEAYNNRGVALLALNQRDAARQDFERALGIDACQFDARINLERIGIATVPPAGCKFSAAKIRELNRN